MTQSIHFTIRRHLE
nr:unnamed protein product [Callosobruchus chinensis]